MKRFTYLMLALTAIAMTGCGIGDAPKGMSGDDAKSAIDKMSPQDKIKAIAGSPMPGPEKQKKFEEIEKQTGVKASDVLGGRPAGAPGAGQAPGN